MLPLLITRPLPNRSRGFTLVEIMIGAVIGMLGIIVMMQVFALSEAQRRSSVSGTDAQNTAAIAMYGLQREIGVAGFGSTDQRVVGCDVLLPNGVTLSAMAPVTINHPSITGQDANTDTLLVVFGNTNGSPQGDPISTQPAAFLGPPAAATPDIYNMATASSFNVGDYVVATASTFAAVPRPSCSGAANRLRLSRVATVDVPSSNVIVTAGTGQAGMANGRLFSQGATPRVMAYAIRNGNLTRCDYLVNDCGLAGNNASGAIWIPIAGEIVSLRAEYGSDNGAVNGGTNRRDSILDTFDQTQPATNCGWTRVNAVRLVLVARNGAYDKAILTAAAPTWDGTTVNTAVSPFNPTSVPIDLSAMTDWQHYRYKVFETVVPIRNMAWNGVPPGC